MNSTMMIPQAVPRGFSFHSLTKKWATPARVFGSLTALPVALAARGGTRRRTESGEAPGWQGATNEHIGHM